MRPKQKSDRKPKQLAAPKEESAIVKLGTELKEVQGVSATIVRPHVSILSDPELYFAFMEIAAMNIYATRKSTEALKVMTQLFTQYQEYKNSSASEYDIAGMFEDSHATTKKEEPEK